MVSDDRDPVGAGEDVGLEDLAQPSVRHLPIDLLSLAKTTDELHGPMTFDPTLDANKLYPSLASSNEHEDVIPH